MLDAASQARLDAYRNAYDALISGRLPRVLVDQNGERVEYSSANISALRAEIAALTRQGGIKVMGPMRLLF